MTVKFMLAEEGPGTVCRQAFTPQSKNSQYLRFCFNLFLAKVRAL